MDISEISTKLLELNTNSKTDKKNKLTYLSWAHAWAELIKIVPDATYEIVKTDSGLPYFGDDNMGYMCYTKMTIGNITREMWLPVMDGANKAMKSSSYEYTTKYGTKTVEVISMFDVNKTIMRCLTKNIAMFGLGLYIYAGEDLPELSEETKEAIKEATKTPDSVNLQIDEAKTVEELTKVFNYFKNNGYHDLQALCGARRKVIENKESK